MHDDSSTVAALHLRRIRNADANILQEQYDVVKGTSAGHHQYTTRASSKRSVENSSCMILIVVYLTMVMRSMSIVSPRDDTNGCLSSPDE